MRLAVTLVILVVCSLAGAPASAGVIEGVPGDRAELAGLPSDGAAIEGSASDGAAIEGKTSDGPTSSSGTTANEQIQLTQSLSLASDRPGEIDVTLIYEVPANVVELTTHLPDEARVTDEGTFHPSEGNEYRWTGNDRTATLTYALDVNRTIDETETFADRGSYTYVDTGQWALIARPATGTSWSWSGGGTVGLERTVATDGPGAAGTRLVFLGEHEEHVRNAHGQTFRLIVPAVADPVESPAAVLDSLVAAADALRIGSRDAEVFIVAAPTGEIEWEYRGLQTGEADMWVRDDERLDTADNIWLHEYVHTRQSYNSSAAVHWTVEGSAVYYAALLSLEQGLIDFDAFHATLAEGEQRPYRDAVLANQSTWRQHPDYQKGGLVAGELDREIRLASEAERSFGDVLRAMNAHDGQVTESDFLRFIEEAGGATIGAVAEEYTRTNASPTMWTREHHDEAFGTLPARIEASLATGDDAYRVSGPYRDRAVGDARPVTLVEGETLAFDVEVHNSGGTTGTYEATLRVDGEAVETRTDRIDGGEVWTLTFERTFDAPGEYELTVGDLVLPVHVSVPATATVTAVDVDRTVVDPGESVTVVATVGNEAAIPATATLSLRLDEVAKETKTVRLDAHDERTVEFTVEFEEPGDYELSLDDHRATVTVVEPTPEEATAQQVQSGGQPGFGVVTAATVLVLLTALLSTGAPRRSPGRR